MTRIKKRRLQVFKSDVDMACLHEAWLISGILLKFFYQQMHFYLTYKILKSTLKHFFTVATTCFGPCRPSSGSLYWAWPKLLFCRYDQYNYVVIINAVLWQHVCVFVCVCAAWRQMGVGGQHHAAAPLPPGKTRYPLYRRLGGPQGRSGRMRKISLPPPGFDPRTVASHYTDWAIATAISRVHN